MIIISFITGVLVGVGICVIVAQIIADRNRPALDVSEPIPDITELTSSICVRTELVVDLLCNGPVTSEKRAQVKEEARGLAQAAMNLHYWARRGTKPLGKLMKQMERQDR